MVKNILGILLSITLLASISVYQLFYMKKEVGSFEEELVSLYEKTEEKTATAEDAIAVRNDWNSLKKTLHVWIPHNDIASLDYWLNETVGLLIVKDYDQALSKVIVLIEISKKLPSSYDPSPENIF